MEAHVSKKVKNLLKLHPSLIRNVEDNKIRCSLTGHEMPCKEEAVLSYLKGRKYQKARARDSSNYDKYKQHISPSSKKYHEHQLFCTLTLRHINKTPEHVERHVNGSRYKRALARWEDCQRKGIPFTPYKRKRQAEEEPADSGKDSEEDESGDVNELDDDAMSDKEEEDGDDAIDNDSFDDLYPAEDFKEGTGDADEDSEYEFDEADIKNAKPAETTKSDTSTETKKRKGEKKKQKQKKKKQKTG